MFKVLFIEALSAIAANKSRTLLTLLGIVIGIASIVTVIAAGNGGKAIIMKEFEGLSPGTIYIIPNYMSKARHHEKITENDLYDLEKYVSEIEDIAPIISMSTVVKTKYNSGKISIMGTNSNYINFVDYSMAEGRVFTEEEVKLQAKVAVIGSLIAEEFFPEGKAVGRYFNAFETPFQVIGVLKRKEKSDSISISDPDENYNNIIVVPVGVFKRFFGNKKGYRTVIAKVKELPGLDSAREKIINVLNKNHGLDRDNNNKFTVIGMKEQLEMIDKVIGSITMGVAILAGIALLVAAIGIMNIMLVSVKERTREIGIRKALGARQRDIMFQFLIETVVLCGGGGFFGLGVAYLAAVFIAHFARWPVIINPYTGMIAVVLSVITGLVSGLYPATRAAKLPPQEALRYE